VFVELAAIYILCPRDLYRSVECVCMHTCDENWQQMIDFLVY
jgi:hypothetical protein